MCVCVGGGIFERFRALIAENFSLARKIGANLGAR